MRVLGFKGEKPLSRVKELGSSATRPSLQEPAAPLAKEQAGMSPLRQARDGEKSPLPVLGKPQNLGTLSQPLLSELSPV